MDKDYGLHLYINIMIKPTPLVTKGRNHNDTDLKVRCADWMIPAICPGTFSQRNCECRKTANNNTLGSF